MLTSCFTKRPPLSLDDPFDIDGSEMRTHEGKSETQGVTKETSVRRMNATLNPVSEGIQRTRPTVCEQPFMEGLPPNSDGGGLDPGRRNVKGMHCSDAPHVTEQQWVVPKCLWKVQILQHFRRDVSFYSVWG